MAGSLDKAVEEAVRSILLETHTMLPGVIKSFDPEKQLATVQLTIMRTFINNGSPETYAITPLEEVPIRWPRAGGYMITFPIKEGDECMVEFAERSIDKWLLNGGVVDPEHTRRHHYSDAIAHVGLWNQTNPIKEYNNEEPEFRTEDGIKKVWLSDDGWVEMVNEELDTRVVLKANGDVRAANDKVSTSMEILENQTYRMSNPVSKFRGNAAGDMLMRNPLIDRQMKSNGNIRDKTIMALHQMKRDGERRFKNLLIRETLGKSGALKVKTLLSKFEMLPSGQARLGTALNKLSINPIQSSLGGAAASLKALPLIGKTLISDSTGTITPTLVLNLVSIVSQIAQDLGLEDLLTGMADQLLEIEDLVDNVIQPDIEEPIERLRDSLVQVFVEKGIDTTTPEVKNLLRRSDNFSDSWDNNLFDVLIDDVIDYIGDKV